MQEKTWKHLRIKELDNIKNYKETEILIPTGSLHTHILLEKSMFKLSKLNCVP